MPPRWGARARGKKKFLRGLGKGKVGPLPILKRTGPGRDPAYVR